jgi:DNA polymerase-3 subunit gamma/tau
MDLNLTRKWRSRTFDGIVGQSLVVRMLKNSLYRDRYFPVYLFSGQRGCGKTTTARIFAAAVNCEQLPHFQKDPKAIAVPCLECPSCTALFKMSHPDFIEIDAASHTGVDNVRQIIEAASLMPVLGRKKIYLIDEAHMLSKAAFNAFLKILEEPPLSVLFILATTDPHKIIDTVRSRCFQIFFQPISVPEVAAHLQELCTKESIAYESAALNTIAANTQGSARDAINLLERVRFAYQTVTQQAVLHVLGYIDDEQLIMLIERILDGDVGQILSWFEYNKIDQHSAGTVWDSFIELVRALVWAKHTKIIERYKSHEHQLTQLAQRCSTAQLTRILQIFYDHELLFHKTTAQHHLLENMIISLCLKNETSHTVTEPKNAPVAKAFTQPKQSPTQSASQETKSDNRWSIAVLSVEKLDDPLVNSLFKHGRFVQFDEQTKLLEVAFGKDFIFFQDWLNSTQKLWQPLVEEQFGAGVQFTPHFIDEPQSNTPVPVAAPKVAAVAQVPTPKITSAQSSNAMVKKTPATGEFKNYSYEKKQSKPVAALKRFDVSDKEKWKKAHIVLQLFPGIISEVQQ